MCEFEALNYIVLLTLIVFQCFILSRSSILKTEMKLKKLINYKEHKKCQSSMIYKQFQSKSCREKKSSGVSLSNAELDEVVVVVVELETSLFLRSPHLHLL